jgi:hypothetical protein
MGTSKNPWFFEVLIGTGMCQPKSKLQGFDFEAKRKRRFSFCVRSKNPGGVFRDSPIGWLVRWRRRPNGIALALNFAGAAIPDGF